MLSKLHNYLHTGHPLSFISTSEDINCIISYNPFKFGETIRNPISKFACFDCLHISSTPLEPQQKFTWFNSFFNRPSNTCVKVDCDLDDSSLITTLICCSLRMNVPCLQPGYKILFWTPTLPNHPSYELWFQLNQCQQLPQWCKRNFLTNPLFPLGLQLLCPQLCNISKQS